MFFLFLGMPTTEAGEAGGQDGDGGWVGADETRTEHRPLSITGLYIVHTAVQ